jgi:putative transposase
MTIQLVDEAVANGATSARACEELGISERSVERWRSGKLDDARQQPTTEPHNRLSVAEREKVILTVTSEEFRDSSPNQIVPILADRGSFIASESTMYRILKQEKLDAHRGKAQPASGCKRAEHVATGPCQVWSWDITYLKSAVRGQYFYLYMIVDVWSRKVVGWQIHAEESMEHSSKLIEQACLDEGVERDSLVLHSDNGGPMRGATMVATLERLGIMASFSRPRVSDDNPYSEALFRTMKYRPEFPTKPFVDVGSASDWVDAFVRWYNRSHLHSGIAFVTPEQRHVGDDVEILARRKAVYAIARSANPQRWSRAERRWERPATIALNRDDGRRKAALPSARARPPGGEVGAADRASSAA